MDLSKAAMKKLILLLVIAALALTAAQWLGSAVHAIGFLIRILSPFLLGAAIAFILNVPMRFLERKLVAPLAKKKRPAGKKPVSPHLIRAVSMALTFLTVGVVVFLLITVVAPQLAVTAAGLSVTIRSAFERFLAWAEYQFSSNPQVVAWMESITIDWQGMVSGIFDFLKNGASDVLTSTITAARSVVGVVTDLVIGLVFAVYILSQKEKLCRQFKKAAYALLPQKAAAYLVKVCSLTHRIFSSFITGQCMEALILGFLFFVTMSLFGMPYALLVGCLIAVTALVPIVGAFIGCFVGALLLLMESPMQALTFVIMFLILQQVEGNLIYPHVVGSSVGLPSIWVLLAVTLGGSLMGVAGMLLFIPLFSVAYALFREFVNHRLEKRQIEIP